MNKQFCFALAALALGAWFGISSPSWNDSAPKASAVNPANAIGGNIAKAVGAFLEGLDEKKRAKASFEYGDKERFNWHFIPRPRKGLPINELRDKEEKLGLAILKASLSAIGYKTVEKVRTLEAVLAKIEGPNRRFPRDPDLYFFSIFGKPSEKDAWAYRFEGHHLCLNFAFKGHEIVSATPLMLGANPGEVTIDHPMKGQRVLGSLEYLARALITSLPEDQRKAATGEGNPKEMEGMQSATYNGERPEGLTLDKLTKDQKKATRKLFNQYLRHLDDASKKAARQVVMKGDWSKIHFVWRGGLEAERGHSYIFHSPDFVINYANFQNGAKHVHAGFRNLKGEFGVK